MTFNRRHGEQCLVVTISANGTHFRSDKKSDTFRSALDECIESIERQIRKNKTRLEKRLREGAFDAIESAGGAADVEEERELIIRTKSFRLKPMTSEEAILQMNLLDHEFFMFVDSSTGDTCVVYRRADGNYGLIVPEK